VSNLQPHKVTMSQCQGVLTQTARERESKREREIDLPRTVKHRVGNCERLRSQDE